ncbi:hypothetical protein NLU13_3601 [Sarocladium strictum]|uniref:Sfi1 spindle body domain-containing protein n=1 Tax=Sarocladium strictum TaxID=5046 RepID=A0AA39GNR9_SARSR|nr:hypothetical protein NLU13_3601 [Sarocladium strictum]
MAQMQSPARFSVNTDPSPYASPAASGQHTDTVPDLFYSDQDVIILHDIVSLAQHDLDNAPAPKPLPAAALFKAYDEVLPQYGIDPDGDHHFSAFVFRVGGEEGDAPLLDKFQTILGQLGITVELGEDREPDVQLSPAPSTTRSVRSILNRALRPYPRTTPERPSSSRNTFARVPELQDASHEQTEESSLDSPAAIATERHALPRNDVDGFADAATAEHDVEEPNHDQPKLPQETGDLHSRRDNGPPPQLESDLNRWIRAAKIQRANIFTSPARTAGTDAPSALDMTTPERPIESRQSQVSQLVRDQLARPANPSPPSLMSLIDGWRGSALLQPRGSGSPVGHRESPLAKIEPAYTATTDRQEPGRTEKSDTAIGNASRTQDQPQPGHQSDHFQHVFPTKQAAVTAVLSQAKQDEVERRSSRTPLTQEQTVRMQIQQQKLMYRATRARELYLASKFFNQWADRTARRLEREGVARRHMIRFRCFRGWSHMPSSRDPAIDRMRMSAALRKLLRATSEHQEELDGLAACGTQICQRASALKALSIWKRRVAVSEAQDRATERLKARMALRWQMQSATHAASLEAARLRGRQTRGINTLINWQEKSENHLAQATAAHDIGDAKLGFHHLRNWWDKSEISRRSAVFNRFLYTEKAAHALSIWNLAARSQAFKWNNDFRTVSRIFDKWELLAQHDQDTEAVATSHYAERARSQVLRGLDRARRNQKRADRVQGRVRLFITATKTLAVFDEAVTKRKAEEKERVKKILKNKHKQASSARKKRQFFTALTQWQQSASESNACAQRAADTRSLLDDRKQERALDLWVQQTKDHDEKMDQAVQHYVLSWLDQWTAFSAQVALQEAQAWETWALEQQRAALKDWSIMSLQRGGQAHTASVAYQKHSRDRRHRALQIWKVRYERAKGGDEMDADLGFTPVPASTRSYRQSWRLFSDRSRGMNNRSSVTSMTDTPTRWTGQLSLMSSTMGQNPMPVVEEADEKDSIKSPARVAPDFDSPIRGRQDDNVFGGLPSTTPLAPVPSHLHQGFNPRRSSGAKSPAWPRSALKQRATYVPSNLGPVEPQRMFPRSLQERSRNPLEGTSAVAASSSLFSRRAESELTEAPARTPYAGTEAFATTPRPLKMSRSFGRNSPRAQDTDMDETPTALAG